MSINVEKLKSISQKLDACHMALYALYSVSSEVSESAMKNISEMLEEITADVEEVMNDENR